MLESKGLQESQHNAHIHGINSVNQSRIIKAARRREEASYLFKYLILTQIAVYLEAGAIPCILDELTRDTDMNAQQQGALGGIVYLALSAASPMCGYLLQRYNVKYVLACSLVANNICVLGFALTPIGLPASANLLILARALIGFTQAFPCVYTPLWVDEFAPPDKAAGWMSYLQGSVPLGVMFGYLIGAISNWVSPNVCYFICWRWPFLLQFLFVLPLMVAIFFFPAEHLNIQQNFHQTCERSGIVTETSSKPVNKLNTSAQSNIVQSHYREETDLSPLIENSDSSSAPSSDTGKLSPPPTNLYSSGLQPLSNDAQTPLNNSSGKQPISSSSSSKEPLSNSSSKQPLSSGSNKQAPISKTTSCLPLDSQTPKSLTHGPASFKRSISHHHPHANVLLEENTNPTLRWSFNGGRLTSFHDDLNLSQRNAIRASYITPRVRLDSYDFDHFLTKEDLEQHYQSLMKTSHLERSHTLYGSIVDEESPMVFNSTDDQLLKFDTSTITGVDSKGFVLPQHQTVDLEMDFEKDEIIHFQECSYLESLSVLLHNAIFVCIVLGLASLYFVVTGVQYWSTIFMIKSLHASRYLVNVLFVIISGTGPILGVFFGGYIIDRYGGYIGEKQRIKALEICIYLGLIAFVIAMVTTFLTDIFATALCLWGLLFFGGSILPACTGIFISVTPLQHRALASSLSVMVFNLLGYSLSPYLTGIVMDWVLTHHQDTTNYFHYCDDACAYRLGFRFCLAWSVWALIFLVLAWTIAKNKSK